MPVLVELVDSCHPEVSIWGAWRMTCALYMLLSLLKILTRDNHSAQKIGSEVNVIYVAYLDHTVRQLINRPYCSEI
jgi:hypothetical protein